MWQGIQGHDAVVEQFRRTLAAGRLATTYLFLGPDGVGKRAFALKLAKALLCMERDTALLDPCGQCESCRLAAAGNHPDLHVVRPEPGKKSLAIKLFIGEDERRGREGLCHDIALRPMMGRRKVAIIEEADWFTPESANCLLKVLEEPPPGAVMILLGTSRGRQLPTILSRSQIVRFDPLPEEVVNELVQAEGLAADPATAARLAARSGGSIARARDLADEELWRLRDRIAAQWDAGSFDAARVLREIEELIDAAGKTPEDRRGRLRQLFALVGDALRQQLREPNADRSTREAALEALDRCVAAEEELDRNANQATLIECWLDDLATIAGGRTATVRN